MDIDQIFKNNKKWVQKKLKLNENYFKELSADQNPNILYVGCSDSRVSSEELMGAKPGEVFVLRNIANMVSSMDLGAMSIITYAVDILKVEHIIICGHYECGGVKAAMESTDLGILNPWLRNIRDIYRLHKDELNNIKDEDAKFKRLVELNVREQCINVLKTSEVQIAYRKRGISVHGWVFDIYSGNFIDLEVDVDKLLKGIREIYRLD